MEVKTVPIADVIPYENNPRSNDNAVDSVATSLRDFGFRQPIVVDAAMVVIAGHTRLKAAHRLGLKDVPIHVASGLSKAQVAAYRVADNKTGELAGWDDDALAEELARLEGEYDLSDFEDWGFTAAQLRTLLPRSKSEVKMRA